MVAFIHLIRGAPMRSTHVAVLLLLATSHIFHAQAPQLPLQEPRQPPPAPIPLPPSNPASTPQLTSQDVTAFLDGFLPLQLQRDDVAGATISITQNGQVLLLKGYGYADWKKKTPVDPVTTAFRPGSISKLPTYIAMMQLVEQGKLSLDADIQQYLDFRIEPGPAGIGDAPITLRRLATHTAGFEEEFHDFGSDQSGRLPRSIGDFLKRNQPHRFALPGKALAYSNYGITLIGYIVQRTSGEPYEQYIQRHIFQPLGMTHSTYTQPLPAGVPRSLGYNHTAKEDTGFEGVTEFPAGGLSSSAADMAIFGQMLLGNGTYNGMQILQPSSVAQLFTPQVQPSPNTSPWDLGFYDEARNGLRFIGHGGDLIGFHSQFWVEPTHHLTFFISYNSSGSSRIAREELFRAFVDRYLPGAPAPHPAFLKLSAKELAPYTGTYLSSRRADSTKFRLFGAIGPRIVAATKEGELTISTAKDFRGASVKFKPIGNDNFYDEEGQSAIHFERDARGRVTGYAGPGHADRAPLLLRPTVFHALLSVSLATALLVILAPLARAWRRTFQRRRGPLTVPAGTRWLPASAQFACLMCILIGVQLLVVLASAGELTSFSQVGALDRTFLVQNLLTLTALIAIAVALLNILRALAQPMRFITRIKFAFTGLTCLYFAWFALFFHFIGSASRY